MKKCKKIFSMLCLVSLGICMVFGRSVHAKNSIYKNMRFNLLRSKCTVYVNQEQKSLNLYNISMWQSSEISQKKREAAYEKVNESFTGLKIPRDYCIPKEDGDKIDLSDDLILEYYKLKKTYEGDIKLEGGEEVGTISAEAGGKEKKKDPLSVIIKK